MSSGRSGGIPLKRGRILTAAEAAGECRSLRSGGRLVVFTNGCFDILHRGHIHLLETAAGFGDVLVVGLNTDDSVRTLKGIPRPLFTLEERASVLCSIGVVDIVVPFAEETPLELIGLLVPDVLVKGGDYTVDTVVGADSVLSAGGRVEIVELLPGYSTSSIIRRLRGETADR